MTKTKKDLSVILNDMGACCAVDYTGMTIKQAWGKISSLSEFEWLLYRLYRHGTKASTTYYARAWYGAMAAMAEVLGHYGYVDELNAKAELAKADPDNWDSDWGETKSPCGIFGCWDCLQQACDTRRKENAACNAIRRVVVMPTKAELIACARAFHAYEHNY